MKRWQIDYAEGPSNVALSESDIWTGSAGVTLVTDLGDEPPPAPEPRTLSATAFNKYAASHLGLNGMARFIEIMDGARAAGGVPKFCAAQYDKALTFDKSEVDAFSKVLVLATIMTSDERDAILDNWPTD